MAFTMEVPNEYGYVILSCIIGPFMANMYMAGPVMNARKDFDVPYPNLYATPGYHKKADEFNRVQRGHLNMLESLTSFTVASLVAGLKYPLTCAVYGVLYSVGSILYQKGYGDTTLDVKMARYKKGGAIKFIGYLGAMGSTVALAGSMLNWW